jgi:hypothetical protein
MSAFRLRSAPILRSTVRGTLVAAGLAALGTHSSAVDAAGICQDRLADNVYSCNVRSDADARFQDCLRFSAPGSISEDFDLFSDNFNDVLACDCKTRGTLDQPEFGTSLMFQCVSNVSQAFNVAFQGRAGQSRITRGQAINSFGDSFVFECTIDPACELSVPRATAGAPAPPATSSYSGLAVPR